MTNYNYIARVILINCHSLNYLMVQYDDSDYDIL